MRELTYDYRVVIRATLRTCVVVALATIQRGVGAGLGVSVIEGIYVTSSMVILSTRLVVAT